MNAATVATQASFDEVIAKVSQIAPQAAETAERVQQEFAEAARQSNFRSTMDSLKRLGPEGERLARGLQQNLDQASAESEGSIDGIIEKIRDIDPAAAQVAERLRVELAAADAKTNFDRSLAELRKINPEAAKAAATIREKMDAADNEVKFDGIIEELRKVDPVAAAEAAKMRKHLNDVPKEAGDRWDAFATKAGTAIKSVVGAYVGAQGLSAAMEVVSGLLDDHSKKIADATNRQNDLAKAQQEAAKNLAAFSAVERDELLQRAVPEIAREAGFMDPTKITLALGTAASKGADAEEARSAVLAAARVERLTPDNLEDTAAGAISVQKSTGLEDARQAIALIQTTGTQSAITDPGKTIENLSKALVGVSTVPNQLREQAAIENAAIFATITKGGNDSEGNASATATINLTNKLSSFFGDIQNTQVELRSELERLERKDKPLEKDLVRIAELKTLVPQVEAITDPGTLMGRIEALQQRPEVAKEFIGAGFGEAQFQQVFRDLTDATSAAAQNLREASKAIKADAAAFEAQAAAQINLTPQLRGAALRSQAAAAIAAEQGSNIEGSSLNDIRSITETALKETRLPGMFNFRANLAEEAGIQPSAWRLNFGDTAAEEAVSNLDRLFSRRRRIAEAGISPSEAPQVAALDAAMESVRRLVVDQAEFLDPKSIEAAADRAGARVVTARAQFQDERAQFFSDIESEFRAKAIEVAAAQLATSQRMAAALEQQNTLVAQQNGLLAQTESNTRPEAPEPPNFDAAFQSSLIEQDAR
jgi:archaellum component FlaC